MNAIGGPFPPLPFEPEGDDISEQIEAHRHLFPINEMMVVMDPPEHTRARSLLSRLLTPARLKENEDFMWELADRQLDEFIGNGKCEVLAEYGKPFATLVIADLLGVPEVDRAEFRASLGAGKEPGVRSGHWITRPSRSTRWNGWMASSPDTSTSVVSSRARMC